MAMHTLNDLYVEELKDLYSAEQQIIKALPKMVKAASAVELKEAFSRHLDQTHEQVKRLDRIFEELGRSPHGKRCKGMEGIVEEGRQIINAPADPTVKDAGLISAAQRVEHYEMAGYGAVRAYARLLGYDDAAHALQRTCEEEGDTDHQLTRLAERVINPEAAHESAARGTEGILVTEEFTEDMYTEED